jgi:hypothetical protein
MLLYLRMACPHFAPREPLTRLAAGIPKPLGDTWLGECCAGGVPVSERQQVEWCNMGYAAGKCGYFVPGGPDAVRFSVAADTAGRVVLRWCAERNHLPFAHGTLEYDRGSGTWSPHPQPPVFDAQARAYLSSYLRRLGDGNGR